MVYFGDVGVGQEVTGMTSPVVEFDSLLTNGQTVMLELCLVDSTSDQWDAVIPVVVAAPVFSITSYGIDDRSGGDGDFVVEPDETILMTLEVYNDGLTYGAAQVDVASLDPYLSVADSASGTGTVQSESADYTLYFVTVSAGCPTSHIGDLEVTIEASDGQVFNETVHFSVGDLTFFDDCESGEGSWTPSGLWHLSSYRSHSDSCSWYYGNEGTHMYPSNSQGTVVSQQFLAGEENTLSFWFWYDFTTYGVDGVYVIVEAGGVPDTLDFIGSGGALEMGALNIVSDWVKWEQDLTDVAVGDTVVVSFGFVSDGTDVAEGMYIDDISFSCKAPVLTGVEDGVTDRTALNLRLFPNPVHSEVSISFGPGREELSVDIYTVDGRLVAHLDKPAGSSFVSWDLRDRSGNRVAPGVYLARTAGKGGCPCAKLVVLR
jgi:hypothetical protein